MGTVTLNALTKRFAGQTGEVGPKDVSLFLEERTVSVILGPNGCGKSTLLHVAAGLSKQDSGAVSFNSQGESIDQKRVRIGFVFQDARSSFLPWLDIKDNVALPARLAGATKKDARLLAEECLQKHLPTVSPRQRIWNLSGGQIQIAALLRATMTRTDLICLDEPFSALDPEKQWVHISRIERELLGGGAPILCVSHDIDEALLLADQLVLLGGDGRVKATLKIPIERPRNPTQVLTPEHLELRQVVVKQLFNQEGSITI